jgi:hypothetical protein
MFFVAPLGSAAKFIAKFPCKTIEVNRKAFRLLWPLPATFSFASPEVLVGEFIARNYRPTFASAGPLIMQ